MADKKTSKIVETWKTINPVQQPNDVKDFHDIIKKMTFLMTLGPYYYFVLNSVSYEFDYVSDSVRDVLGIEPKEFTLEKLLSLYYPEDFQKLQEKEEIIGDFIYNYMSDRSFTDAVSFGKALYLKRLRYSSGAYKTILHQVMALNVSDDGKIQHSLVVHADVSHLNMPIDHKVSFIFDQGPSYYAIEKGSYFKLNETNDYTSYTRREVEIIKSISEGKDFNEISGLLHISPHTVRAHKRNILKKSGAKNSAELIAKCVREGVI
ncbi:helix-turn-helix transcriptional regulator [Algibacter sp. 2305UL17-15]|uniref:response regulator transcription factor n=1 Tax=Algibacter sp. 2305UL17-15 TaxID=3231268 RepID=UPI003459AA70